MLTCMHNMPPHAGGAIAGIVGAFGVIMIAAAIIIVIAASTIYKRQKQANPPPRRADYAEINPHDASRLNDQQ